MSRFGRPRRITQVARGRSLDSLFREPIIGIYDSEGIISSRLVKSAPVSYTHLTLPTTPYV